MSSPKNAKTKSPFKNIKGQVFLQFILIFLIILCAILLTSNSLYTNIISGMTLSNLRDSVEVVKKIDTSGSDVIQQVEEIEINKSVFIEVYGKAPGDRAGEFSKRIYTKYAYDIFTNSDSQIIQHHEAKAFINFNLQWL